MEWIIPFVEEPTPERRIGGLSAGGHHAGGTQSLLSDLNEIESLEGPRRPMEEENAVGRAVSSWIDEHDRL